MHYLHSNLKRHLSWYTSWHNHPRHKHFHWLIAFSALLILSSLIVLQLFALKLTRLNIKSAHAQAALPAPSHQIEFTYYLIDSQFGDFRSEVKNTVGPYLIFGHNSAEDYAELTGLFQNAATDNKRVIYGPPNPWLYGSGAPSDQITDMQLDIATPHWNRIDWIYFDEPNLNKSAMEQFINNFNSKLNSRGLSLKPIGINFTEGQFLNNTGYQASNIDYVGLEAYVVDESTQNNPTLTTDLNAKLDQLKTLIGSRPKFIVIQAYDRNGRWTNMDSLKAIQTVPYLNAYNDQSIRSLLAFSYGRNGGTRQLDPCIRTEHLRIWGAINGTSQPASIPCSGGTTSSSDPIGRHNPNSSICTDATTNGWACDSDNFNQALTANLYLDGPAGSGTLIAQQTANIDFGSFVGSQCGGNRNHGWTFNIPTQYFDGSQHSIYAYGVNIGAGSNTLLTDSPLTFTCGTPPPGGIPPTSPPSNIPPGGTPPGPGPTSVLPPTIQSVSNQPSGPNPCTQDQIDAGSTGVGIICDFSPSLANPGDTIQVSGINLTTNINLYSQSGAIINVTGTPQGNGVVSFIIPSSIQEGDYTLGIIGANFIDEATITKVLTVTTLPVFYSSNAPIGCDPAQVALGIPIICDMDPTTVFPGDTVTITGISLSGRITLIGPNGNFVAFGSANSNGTQATFIVPVDVLDGTYDVADGIAIGTQQLTVTTAPIILANFQPPPPFGPPSAPLSPPPATNFQDLINNVLTYAVYVVGIAVFIMIMWGGFLWMTSAANPANIATAKHVISNAVLGAILLVSSYVILYTINPDLTGSTFTLQEIGGGSGSGTAGPGAASVKLLAFTEAESGAAITNGCLLTREMEDFSAVECPSSVAGQLNLTPNPQIDAQGAGVNTQIRADIVHNNNNTGTGVTVAVIDTGYNYNHPELSSSYVGGYDFVNDDNDPMDDQVSGGGAPGHGSHVAGIITADGNDPQAKGVAPDTRIVAAKILDQNGNGDWDDLIAAIRWVVDNHSPDIINMSVGGGNFSSICDNTDNTTRGIAEALRYARANGALPIVAAGNNIPNVMLPGCISHALTVSAVDSTDTIAGFSGRGTAVDVSAPGVNLYSALLGNNYGNKSGTSQAAPVVSGVAALIKSLHPNYSVKKLQDAIIASSIDLGFPGRDNNYGWGRVTADAGNPGGPPVVQPPTLPQPPNTTPSEEQCNTGGNVCGRIWPSLISCLKGTTAPTANPNCNIVLSYINNSSGSVEIRKNGSTWRTITAQSGTQTDSNPPAGIYTYTMHLPTGEQIGTTTTYIYTRGSITSGFNACATTANPANPNCDVTLTITTYGVNPVFIGKDGVTNWQTAACPTTGSCTTAITDTAPALGIRTYTIHDGTNNARLARATVNISQGIPPSGGGGGSGVPIPPPGVVILCSQPNFTGTCEGFFTTNIANLTNTIIGNNNVASLQVGTPSITLCTNMNWRGTCETFANGNHADLSTSTIGASTASSMQQ